MSKPSIVFVFKGLAPCLQHNSRLANPLDPVVRAMKPLHAKKKKTESDFEDLARLEFLGSLYTEARTDDGWPSGPVIWPDVNVEALFLAAAKKEGKGPKVKAGLRVPTSPRLIYPKPPANPCDLWDRHEHRLIVPAKVQGRTVMRCRPIFRQWELRVQVDYDDRILNADDIILMAEVAGREIGLSDWHPRYGQFTAEVAKGARAA